jgi:hypothetical protein
MYKYIELEYLNQYVQVQLQRVQEILIQATVYRKCGKDIKELKLSLTDGSSKHQRQAVDRQIQDYKLKAEEQLRQDIRKKAVDLYEKVVEKVKIDYDKLMGEVLEASKKRDQLLLDGMNMEKEMELLKQHKKLLEEKNVGDVKIINITNLEMSLTEEYNNVVSIKKRIDKNEIAIEKVIHNIHIHIIVTSSLHIYILRVMVCMIYI